MYLRRLSPVMPTLLFLLMLIVSGCKKMLSEEGPPPDYTPPVQIVQTSIEGRVLNEQSQPVQNAFISGGGQITTTNEDGHFLLENIRVLDDAAVVSVQKNGYFRGYRTLMVRPDQSQYVQLELLLKNENKISATTGDLIPFPEGTLTFPPNAVLTAGNQPYDGTVTVRSFYIHPIASTVADQMPGDLRGVDKNNKQLGLRAFSMIVFTMEDAAGTALQPDPAKPASFRIMIPNELTSSAPQQIPLWRFDEATGFWKEEGQATRQGNDYTGTAGQTGYWLCATTFPQITLTAHVKDQQAAPLSNTRVTLLTKPDFIPTFGFTNVEGTYYGKAAANTPMTMILTDNCFNVLRQQEIGPFSVAAEISNVNVTLAENETLIINGTAKDCDQFNVISGKVIVNVEQRNYTASISNGNFSVTVLRCSSQPVSVTFTATDSRTNQTSTTTIRAGAGTITPALEVCN
ncbi:hypothetical protein L3C95_03645 [Chitinophaga filiformis]|uniref:carboxypeptidase-like regulatory domain-containing protein n=1 Tax=Chitinophaga filiformis TaxID=104663 RepID=UPI001F4446E1|nr:carboxypeptidase-like regulatory domain-containing protein [Chitinophaga filiformis]MCF6401951.1 hypothetical protein [Chitinophaga filiformis]